MAKITLTAEEEFMYLSKLNKLQEIMPELEIEVISKPFIPRVAPSNIGEEFRSFLRAYTPSTIIVPPAFN